MARYRYARSEMPRSRPAALDEDPFTGAAVLERRALIDAVLHAIPARAQRGA